MAVLYSLTFICDICEEEHLVDSEYPSLPPHWITAQITVSNKDGLVNEIEENTPLMHFCSQKCMTEFISSQEMKERILLVDMEEEQSPPEENDNE